MMAKILPQVSGFSDLYFLSFCCSTKALILTKACRAVVIMIAKGSIVA